jgi:hypothetical protein
MSSFSRREPDLAHIGIWCNKHEKLSPFSAERGGIFPRQSLKWSHNQSGSTAIVE